MITCVLSSGDLSPLYFFAKPDLLFNLSQHDEAVGERGRTSSEAQSV